MIHRVAAIVALLAGNAIGLATAQTPSLILTRARVWTGDSTRPWAEAVAIEGSLIRAVGSRTEVEALAGPTTRVLRLDGRFIAPGFIDNHTHFNSAGALLLGVNLLDVADEAGLVQRVREARERLPRGAWMIGGDWGAYEAWNRGSTGRADSTAQGPPFDPGRDLIDSLTPDTPTLLNRWDRTAYLANGAALRYAGAECRWPGVACEGGRPTGRLSPQAASRIRAAAPPKSLPQRLAEAKLALRDLAQFGVTSIHDITPPEQFEVYRVLAQQGELTVRVYARPTLDRIGALRTVGMQTGFGNEWVTLGGLKGFVDGIMGNSTARFYEPYLTSGKRGDWRTMMAPAGNMERLLAQADSAGYWPQVHAIGDFAIDTLLNMFERVMRANGPKPRRFRVIHAQVLRGPEVAARMARLGLIAEVQPYHAIDDMRWMEQRIGPRSRWAYAFKTLRDAGVRLSFGSDWPGTNASWYPSNPVLGMYAAVTRQTLDGKPAGGWFPEERIDLETALRAYTVNNAYAAGEEGIKGMLKKGMLADVVVLDRDPFVVPPEQIKQLEALYTIVGGRVVFER